MTTQTLEIVRTDAREDLVVLRLENGQEVAVTVAHLLNIADLADSHIAYQRNELEKMEHMRWHGCKGDC